MKKQVLLAISLLANLMAAAEPVTIQSPNKKLSVVVNDDANHLTYKVIYNGVTVVEPSSLGLTTSFADFYNNLKISGVLTRDIDTTYTLSRSKRSTVHYCATQTRLLCVNNKKQSMQVVMNVGNHDVAFRYEIQRPKEDNPKQTIVQSEQTSFRFPDGTTTFLSPQIQPMTGWEQTKPSYEEEYQADAPMAQKSQYGVGYTFPCLFHERQTASAAGRKQKGSAQDYWVLVSETGVTGDYCGSRLSDFSPATGYQIAYPQQGECNGWGSSTPGISLPGATPWRTITVGESLAPIVETTVPFDVVEPRYEAKYNYRPGRYTWSWLIWQDNSVNYDDQVKFIDLAAKMGYEYVLVDGIWDKQIGYEGIEKLAAYAKQKGVSLMLWYNSNGFENNAPQTPRNVMNRPIERKKAMAWMQKIGVKGIKVDFFGGDKQNTMQLYEDILSDANDYGLQVIFHGCTLPRGWERLYPNYVASEAALASENVFFSEHHAKQEGFEMTMHPFCRNAVGSFDWGGVIMNHKMSPDNKSRHRRYTTDVFEMATAITNQTSINCVEVTPGVVDTLPQVQLDFLKQIPTTWEDTRFVDGYPTRYAVIARCHDGHWYVGGINGTQKAMTLTLNLPMLKGQTVDYYTDEPVTKTQEQPATRLSRLKVDSKGRARVTLQPMGGIILVQR